MKPTDHTRRGRPVLSPFERHSVRVTLGFTPDAAALLLAFAAKAGLVPPPVTSCLRLYIETFLARHHRGLPLPPPPALPPELVALRLELHRLGNNLNQAVHIAHATRTGLPTQTPALLDELLERIRCVHGLLDRRGNRP
jgi:hypothetical protein